jgi:hypothetical protein
MLCGLELISELIEMHTEERGRLAGLVHDLYVVVQTDA